jgi:hypothetical protein
MLLEVFCPNSDIEHQRCDLNLEFRINKQQKKKINIQNFLQHNHPQNQVLQQLDWHELGQTPLD